MAAASAVKRHSYAQPLNRARKSAIAYHHSVVLDGHAQHLDGEHDRAADEIHRMRPAARAHVVDYAGEDQGIGNER